MSNLRNPRQIDVVIRGKISESRHMENLGKTRVLHR